VDATRGPDVAVVTTAETDDEASNGVSASMLPERARGAHEMTRKASSSEAVAFEV